MSCCRWDAESKVFKFYGESKIIISPTAIIEASAAGQATAAAGLPPTTIRKIKVFSVAGILVLFTAAVHLTNVLRLMHSRVQANRHVLFNCNIHSANLVQENDY